MFPRKVFIRISELSHRDKNSLKRKEVNISLVTAMNLAVSQLKSTFGTTTQIQLIGYSGGGATAALIAARRDDISRLITVAGNLDHDKWTQLHTITPLTHSLILDHYINDSYLSCPVT